MMLTHDVASDPLLPLGTACRTLAPLADGRRIGPGLVARWIARGLVRDGRRVKLAAVRRGRTWRTTASAVAAFLEALPGGGTP